MSQQSAQSDHPFKRIHPKRGHIFRYVDIFQNKIFRTTYSTFSSESVIGLSRFLLHWVSTRGILETKNDLFFLLHYTPSVGTVIWESIIPWVLIFEGTIWDTCGMKILQKWGNDTVGGRPNVSILLPCFPSVLLFPL